MKIMFFKFFILIIFLFKPAYSEIVNDLKIKGNQRITNETIKVIGDINLGVNYNAEQLNDLTKELYNSNFFKEISIDIKNNTMFIDLIENPIINDIKINGIKRNQIRELLFEKISSKNRNSFSEFILENDINLIKNILKTNGYYFVEVLPSILEDSKLNSVNLILDINLGPKAKIKKIVFIGDKIFKNKKLLEVIASEEHKFWKFISNNVYLDENRVNLDKRLINNFYRNLGYYDVNVSSSFAELSQNGEFNLIYNINAGNEYFFDDLKLNLPSNYNPKDFEKINNKLIKLKGEKYSLFDVNSILSEIENIAELRLYDFIDARVNEEIINNKIKLTFDIADSTKFFVEKINILGNYTTIEEVIRNKLIVDEGDPFNKILFNKSINNIKNLNIFKDVKTNLKDDDNNNLRSIDIIVEEMPTGEISLAAGVGTSGSVIGGGIVEKNFLGKAINLNTNLEISESSIKGQFIYSKPNFAYTDNTLFTSLSSTTSDNLSDFGYKVSELGFSLGTEFQQFENLFFSPEIDISLEDLETNKSASNTLKKQEGNYADLYFNYGLNYDLRNSPFKPSSGNKTTFIQELPLVSDSKELSHTFVFTQYKKLSKTIDTVGKASIYLKAINSISSNEDVRVSKRGNAPYSRLRGFEKGKLGPIDNNDYVGGNYIATLSLSSNLPFILPTVDTVDFSIFFDAANVWGVDYDDTIDDSNVIRSSTGIGMNLLTPVGPLNFSLTKPITKKNTDKTETFRFNLGTTF